MNNIIRAKYWNRIEYTLNGRFHRTDGPARIYYDGSMFWYKDGIRHREYGPAIIWNNGNMHWYQYGRLK